MKHECVNGIEVNSQPDGSVRLTIDEATVTLNRDQAVELSYHIIDNPEAYKVEPTTLHSGSVAQSPGAHSSDLNSGEPRE